MCLDTVDKKIGVTGGEGWKVFGGQDRRDRDDPQEGLRGWFGFGGYIPIGKWVTDRPRRLRLCSYYTDNQYPSGFHLYSSRAIAYKDFKGVRVRRIRKVSFRKVVATGVQDEAPVIVAREIYIHPK